MELRKRKRLRNNSFSNWLSCIPSQYNWTYRHIQEIARRLQPIANGEKKFLMFWLPPQHGKSLTVTKHFPAFTMDGKSSNRIIIGAYNYEYAMDFSRSSKRILRDINFMKFSGRQLANEWETSEGGFLKSFGMQSGITGRAADLVIIDDPVKGYIDLTEVKRETVWNTFVYDIETREQKNTSYIIIQTRWHCDDLSGRLLERDGRIEDGGKWEVLSLPALAEENDPLGREVGEALCPELHTLKRLLERKEKTPVMFQALYQQSPTMKGGNIIKSDWFEYYDSSKPVDFEYKIMSIDGAWKAKENNDYSACTTWGVLGNNCYLIDIWRDKIIYPEFKLAIRGIFETQKPSTILVEDTASGIAFIQEMENSLPVHPVKPEGDKQVRAHMVSDIIRSKRVYLPDKHALLYDFLAEVTSFPNGKNDDMIDTLTQALRYLSMFLISPTISGVTVI